MIFPFKKTWRSRLDLDYLDENSARKRTARQGNGLEGTDARRKLRQFADYASKETLGQVHAGGFFHHRILANPDGTRCAPSQLSNEERKRRLSDAWFAHVRKFPTASENPVLQHRLVFTMSQPFHDRLVAAGINPDRVLQSTMKKVMRQFAERFHPHDAIGYTYGIHHDTDNLHVHVALCPRTAKGAYVGCSMSRSNVSGNKNQMTFLMRCFERENARWTELLGDPEKLQTFLARRLDADKIVFAPRLKDTHLAALRSTQTAEAIHLHQSFESIRNLETAIAARRQVLAAQRNAHFILRLLGRRKSKGERATEKLAAVVDRRSLREMQTLLFRIKRDYRAAHKRYSQTHGFDSYAHRNPHAPAHRQQNGL
ncbi:MAG: hypothetical protein SFU53_11425 [Terrimicrobiaceae bacterium]|nr:hypothetical protein [Terrimicrobiaceae bacterium]